MININTASAQVLQLIPGIDPSLAQGIISTRAGLDGMDGTEDDMPFRTPGELINVPGHATGSHSTGSGHVHHAQPYVRSALWTPGWAITGGSTSASCAGIPRCATSRRCSSTAGKRRQSSPESMGQIFFVTATDTGAGKTLLTALLLVHLRLEGCHALAAKPFCTGRRDDVEILFRAQDRELPMGRDQPVSLRLAGSAACGRAGRAGRTVALDDVIDHIQALAARCDVLLVEGAGGLLVPLGEDYSIASVIAALNCPVILAARNKLGVVNHTLLTLHALENKTGSAGPDCLDGWGATRCAGSDEWQIDRGIERSNAGLAHPVFGAKSRGIGRVKKKRN